MKRIIGALILLLCISACADKPEPLPKGEIDYMGRYEAAIQISNNSDRDDALSKVAIDSAKAGQGDVTLRAINAISSMSDKDDAAIQAAVELNKAGKASTALDVANQISTTSKRDSTLKKIAQGD